MNPRKIKNYDLFPLMALSESYVDKIMTGFLVEKTIVSSSTVPGARAFVTGNRYKVGSAITGSTYSLKQNATDFGFYSNVVSSSVKPEKHAGIRFLTLLDGKEILFDSIPPSFDECMKVYGKGMSLVFISDPTLYQPLLFTYLISAPNFPITSSHNGETLSDSFWLSSYPFSSEYKNAKRVKSSEQFNDFGKYTYQTSASIQDPTKEVKFFHGFSSRENSPNTFSYTSNPNDPFWSSGSGLYARPEFVTICYFLSGTNSNDSSSSDIYEDRHFSFLASESGSVSGTGVFTGFSSVYAEPTLAAGKPKAPQNADIIKHAFGFGDGIDTYIHGPQFATQISSSFVQESRPTKLKYGSRIRGWKYGLLSGFTTYRSAVFRRDHFGQFRDMLEQRIQGKILIEETNTIINPIMRQFVSGTTAYYSASNPHLNTRNSGIYNAEYSSGKPFKDI